VHATFPPYRSALWLRGAHAQTIIPATVIPTKLPAYRRERLSTPDRDFIDLDWVDVATKTAPLLILFHGLEGNSHSHYARSFMSAAGARGWRAVVPHFRGCSGEINWAPRFYHSGDSTEIGWIVERIAERFPEAPLHAAGISLGANALLRWLGEEPVESQRRLRSAAAISAPLDLAAGGHALGHGFNLVYTRSFLRTLKSKCLVKLTQFPGLFDRAAMLESRNLYEFDNIVTAPLHGYRDTEDYWRRAASKTVLGEIVVKTLVLNALNDPFLPASALPQPAQVSRSVHLEFPREGGHVGFYARNAGMRWLPERVIHFLEHAAHG